MRLFPIILYLIAVTLGTFSGGTWAALGIAGGGILFLGTWLKERRLAPLYMPYMIAVLGTLAAIALLNLAASNPAISWHMLLQEATIMLPLALFFHPRVIAQVEPPKLFPVITLAASVAAIAYGLECALGYPMLHGVKGAIVEYTEYNRGISYLAVFAFPMMAYVWVCQPRWRFAVFILLMLIPVMLTESRATRMAFIAGLAVTALAHYAPKLMQRGLIAVLVALITMPFVVTHLFTEHPQWVERLPMSWHHRVEIWDYMSYRIFERPWFGWGIGSSHLLSFEQPHGQLYQMVHTAASHPHNAILQLWVETGLPGLIIGIAAAIAVLRNIARLAAPYVPFAMGAWAACLCISLVAYSFWDDSLFALFALTSLAFILLSNHAKQS